MSTTTVAPSQSKSDSPSVAKWLIGITLGVGLLALAWKFYPTAEAWLTVGAVGAIGLGIIAGLVVTAFERFGAGNAGSVVSLVILLAGAIFAGFLVGGWAVPSFFFALVAAMVTWAALT